MKKNLKKVLAAGLAASMVMSTGIVALADEANQDASFTKTYVETNENTASPDETFTFSFTAYNLTDSNNNLSVSDMPEIPDSFINFDLGAAATGDGTEKDVEVALADIEWPGVGVYYYKVNENVGNTAGVTYDETEAYLKVTVAYDQGTDKYYTAFVTLNLADADEDGFTDSKVAGFKNEYSAGTLSISKEVTGNLGDVEKYFDVTVTFEAPYTIDPETNEKVYKEVMSDIYYNGGDGSFDVDDARVYLSGGGWTGVQTTTIKVKHDTTYEFYNIPYGVTYTVKEDDYTTEADGAYDSPNYTGEIVETEGDVEVMVKGTINAAGHNDEVKIVNNKGVTVDTGISLDALPYLMMLGMSGLGALGFAGKRRKEEDEI